MLKVRRAAERGHFDHGWLRTSHTFSFADYYDPAHMGFRALRVINEDRVAPGTGFGCHGHRDMEIVSYVLSGAIEHRDSTGSSGVLRPGELQRMTAGTGVMHSEMNHGDEELHFLQIWLLPERAGLEPSYEQRAFPEEERRGAWRLLVSPTGEALRIHQDAKIYGTLLAPGERLVHGIAPGRHAWLQVARGAVSLGGVELRAGDGVAVSDEEELEIEALEPAEALLFDLA
ncbi:MAG TPA: pirin family protein [Vulgatibacter sp.]|nr:pirin family protein [Vulgatibacter sp.]